jgi:hypothetical protein
MEFSNQIIEDLLSTFSSMTGKDHERYNNHVYRVFLNCLLIDQEKKNEEKYALAAVFHDIGIWTNHTFDYLNPSIEQARLYLNKTGKAGWITEISQMIYWHHKISKYKGEYEQTVETFRKADWIDVSLGLLSFGIDKRIVKENRRKIPNSGFHVFLTKQTIKNFFKHPFNPLPVFKR